MEEEENAGGEISLFCSFVENSVSDDVNNGKKIRTDIKRPFLAMKKRSAKRTFTYINEYFFSIEEVHPSKTLEENSTQ